MLGLALVIALAGGVSLTALTGARRTASAFPRYLEASHASDVAINPIVDDNGDEDAEAAPLSTTLSFVEHARDLPEVLDEATYIGLETLFLLDGDGVPLDVQPEVVGSLDGRFLDQDRLAVLTGRLPEPDRLDEVAVNRQSARLLHLHVGSTIHLAVPDLSGLDENVDPRDVPSSSRATSRSPASGSSRRRS